MSLVACLSVLAVFPPSSDACTGMRVISKDGSVVFARSMEFGQQIQSDILIAPKGMVWNSVAPDGSKGLQWTTKYAFMGPDGFGVPNPLEGINDQGLYVGGFWMPVGETEFPKIDPADYSKVVTQMDFIAWLLGNCASVEEVKKAVPNLTVAAVEIKPLHLTPLAHWYAMDASGKAIVIEYIKGELRIHENPVGVMTNAPSFDWHLTNLRNYINLHPANVSSAKLGDFELHPLGEGTGLLGLPGDMTPPSRFVRAAIYANTVFPPADADGAVTLGMNMIAGFAIPKGLCTGINAEGKTESDFTQWTTVYDLSNKILYFRTYDNQDYRQLNLDGVSFKDNTPMFIPMWNVKPAYEDVSGEAKPAQ